MLRLQSETPVEWVQQALVETEELLIDHAHCEKKAASTAINLIFRYPEHTQLLIPLSELAREELEHFEIVLGELRSRGGEYRRLKPSAYAGQLMTAVRKKEPHKLLDTLLCCALIEARSCERMKLLSEAFKPIDVGLATLYHSLLASEARHHSLYLDLSLSIFAHEEVMERLYELSTHETKILLERGPELRMHS
jgi:tRNA 2-(methylsulfanyl)-N6-isopentenyladenosine37 hydroxylase